MIWHVLGWLTVASTFVVTGVCGQLLITASRESRTWMRKVPVPAFAAGSLSLSSGSDYVGAV